MVQSKQQQNQQQQQQQCSNDNNKCNRNQRQRGTALIRALSMLIPSKTQPWFIVLSLFTIAFFCVTRIILSKSFLVVTNKDSNLIDLTNVLSDIIIKSVLSYDILSSSKPVSEPGTSSCFKTRTRMMYPMSPNESGCYFENEFTKESANPRKESELFDSVRPYCRFHNFQIDLSKVHSTRYGGEEFHSVMGQPEEDEVLSYDKGAFVAPIPNENMRHKYFGPKGYRYPKHDYVSKALQKFIPIDSSNNTSDSSSSIQQCTRTIPGTTLLIQRDSYVNLFHVVTGDWFNIWLAIDSIQSKQPNLNVWNILYLDARPAGHLDSTWKTLFGTTSYLQHYSPKFRRLQNDTVPSIDENDTTDNAQSNNVDVISIETDDTNEVLCLEDAVFVPSEGDNEFIYAWKSGYAKAYCPDPIIMNRFVDFVLNKYNCKSIDMIPNHIVFIDRRPYKSHPRSNEDNFERIINNLDHVASSLQSILKNEYDIPITYELVQFDRYNMYEQIKIVRQAQILIGYHGAGLTHLLFMHNTNTKVLEIEHKRSSTLFGLLTEWKYGVSTTKFDSRLNHQYYAKLPRLSTANVTDNYISRYLIPAITPTLQIER